MIEALVRYERVRCAEGDLGARVGVTRTGIRNLRFQCQEGEVARKGEVAESFVDSEMPCGGPRDRARIYPEGGANGIDLFRPLVRKAAFESGASCWTLAAAGDLLGRRIAPGGATVLARQW